MADRELTEAEAADLARDPAVVRQLADDAGDAMIRAKYRRETFSGHQGDAADLDSYIRRAARPEGDSAA